MSSQRNVEAPITEFMLIDGQRVDGPVRIEVRNPARPDDLVGTIVRGSPQHVDEAVAAAKAAQPAWASRSFADRAAILEKAISRLENDIDRRAAVFVRENGKPLAEARGELFSVPAANAWHFAMRPNWMPAVNSRRERTDVCVQPALWCRGVDRAVEFARVARVHTDRGCLAGGQLCRAQAAGNLSACPYQLGLDVRGGACRAGTINIVTGMPGEIGDALTTHPDVGKIGFTGSIPSARHIMANAAQTIKGVTLELGGNDPAIILDDTEFDPPTMKLMLNATFMMTGQVCMAIKRIYVPTRRRDEFVDSFRKAAESISVGDGLEPTVNMGPLHTRKAQERAEGLLDDAARRGADIVKLGTSTTKRPSPAAISCVRLQ